MNGYTRWYRVFNASTQAAMEAHAPGWAARRDRFLQRYYNTTQRVWQGFYARGPPILPILPTDDVGSIRTLTTTVPYHHPCSEPNEAKPHELCRGDLPLNITAEVVCSSPQLLRLRDLINEDEIQYIKRAAMQRFVPSQAALIVIMHEPSL